SIPSRERLGDLPVAIPLPSEFSFLTLWSDLRRRNRYPALGGQSGWRETMMHSAITLLFSGLPASADKFLLGISTVALVRIGGGTTPFYSRPPPHPAPSP